MLYRGSVWAYELFYAFATTDTKLERVCFLVWFILDITLSTTTFFATYPPDERRRKALQTFGVFLISIFGLHTLTVIFPDDREQVTAYWTGILLQLPIGYLSVYLLLKHEDTKGHSIEIWYVSLGSSKESELIRVRITRFTGCLVAYAVFLWRYLNVPENWAYVGSAWSLGIMVVTFIPEIIYPFVYLRIKLKKEKRE